MDCKIKLPDGSEKRFPSPPTGLELAESIGPGLARAAVGLALKGEGEISDIRRTLKDGDQAEIVAIPSEKALEVIRHSAAHVMAQAVQSLWPEAKVTIGPVIESGFYYDFDTDRKFTPEDLEAIEREMKRLIKQGSEVTREVWPKAEALRHFGEKGETLKQEIIEGLDEPEVSIYRQGPWLDLCRGPHVRHLGQIGAVKVLSLSGAYWRGDSRNRQLQRIYGTAFHTEKALRAFLAGREEARKNDHRRLGKQLDLFWFSPLSPGSPFWTAKGAHVCRRLQDFLREKYKKYGYEEVITPQIFHSGLFEASGHLSHFSEDMYAVSGGAGLSKNSLGDSAAASPKEKARQGLSLLKSAVRDVLKSHEGIGPAAVSGEAGLPRQTEGRKGQNDRLAQWLLYALEAEKTARRLERGQWAAAEASPPAGAEAGPPPARGGLREFLKPMNCPGHCLLYKKERRSYRELPWRVADFGRLHRNEAGGSSHGLTRVKSFCQDDGHIFCRRDQLSEEIQNSLKMLEEVYQTLGLRDYKIRLSTRPESRMGGDGLWDQAEEALRAALQALSLPFEEEPGGGAFYGPKLDVHVRDAFSRSWQLGTFQCDFNLPLAFGLSYINEKDEEERPVMVHRAVLGSLERFIGVYLEHCRGRLPLWLCPSQAIVLPLTDRERDFSKKIQKELALAGIICETDQRNEKLSYKIRQAQLAQIPYMLIIGKKERESGRLSIRLRGGAVFHDLPLKTFQDRLLEEISRRSLRSLFVQPTAKDSSH